MSTPSDSPKQPARVSRGTLLKRTGAIALGTSLFSMGDPLTVLAVQTKRTALKPDGDLAYFNWAQYINPKLLRGFEKEYGVKVKEANFTNMENMLAKLRSGVKTTSRSRRHRPPRSSCGKVRCRARSRQAHELGSGRPGLPQSLVRPEREALGAVRDLDDRHHVSHGQGQGHDRFLERPLEPPGGVEDTYLLDDFHKVLAMSLLRNGVKDVNSERHRQGQQGDQRVLKLKPRLRGFTSLNTEMANGTSWLTHMWSGTTYQALLASKTPELLRYQVNKEGIPVGSDTMMMLKNAPHPNTAMLFIDWMLRPENSPPTSA